MSVLYRGVFLIESQIKGIKERQGPTLGHHFTARCPSHRDSNKGSKERQGPTFFNSLNHNMNSAATISLLKSRLKTFLLG